MLEISDMKCGEGELDVTKVTVALVEAFVAGLASTCFARRTHVHIHRTICSKAARVVRGGGEVVDIAIRNFEYGLIDDILIGAANVRYVFPN